MQVPLADGTRPLAMRRRLLRQCCKHFASGSGVASLSFRSFWLELDNPFGPVTSAGLCCHPKLGASCARLVRHDREPWRRHNDVVLTACFRRIALPFWWPSCLLVRSLRLRRYGSPQLRILTRRASPAIPPRSLPPDNLGATGGRVRMSSCWRHGARARSGIGIACAGTSSPVMISVEPSAGSARIMCKYCGRDHGSDFVACSPLQRRNCRTRRREPRVRPARFALEPRHLTGARGSSHVRLTLPKLQTALRLVSGAGRLARSCEHLRRLPEAARRRGTHHLTKPPVQASIRTEAARRCSGRYPLPTPRMRGGGRDIDAPARRHALVRCSRRKGQGVADVARASMGWGFCRCSASS